MPPSRSSVEPGARRPGAVGRLLTLLLLGLLLVPLTSVAVATPASLSGGAGLTALPAPASSFGHGALSHLAALRPPTETHSAPAGRAPLAPDNATAKPQWWDVTSDSTTPLPVVEFTEGTWDGADGGVLFYGGDNYAVNLNGTWMYDAGQWSEVATHGNPGPISGGSLAYDPAAGYSVFYGGVTSFSPLEFNNTTYFYANGTWTQAALANSPPVPLAGEMVYDPSLGGIVMFGGINLSSPSNVLSQTWLFRNGTWSLLSTPVAPPGRWLAEMGFDPALNELVLYGGFDASGNSLGDTWVFVNGTWSSVSASGLGVPPTADGYIVYDPDLGQLILAGGEDEFGDVLVGTWGFNGAVWSVVAATGSPHGHEAGIGVWDPIDHELVLAGGGGGGAPSYTDVLSIPLRPVNLTTPNETDVGVPTHFDASALGGAPPYTYVWNWGDDSTNDTASANHTYTSAQSFVVTLTVRGPSTNSVTWQGEITVVVDPVLRATLTGRGIDAGVPASFTASVTGGIAPDTITWSFSDGGTARGASAQHTFAVAGDYTLNVSSVDAAGGVGSTSYALVVNATPTAGVAPVNAPEAGGLTVFQAAVAGGTPPFTYAWQFQGGGTSSLASPSHRFPEAGAAWVNVTVTDSDGAASSANTTVEVVPAVSVTIVGPSSTSVGSTPTFTANISNGASPYSVAWTLPNEASANGSSTDFYFPGAGVFTVGVTVTDSNGLVATSELNVTVTSASTSFLSGTIGGVPTWALIVGVLVIVVVGAGAGVALRARRPPEPPAQPAPPEPAQDVPAEAGEDPPAETSEPT
jgi:PKD repeat protein